MAYRRIGNLLIGYDADSTQFNRTTDQVRAKLGTVRAAMARLRQAARRLGRRFAALSRQMLSLRGLAGVLAGVGGFGLLMKRAADYGAELKELSLQVGLSVKQLQGWQRVFEANGLAAEKTRKVLGQFSYAVAEAARGSETYARLFRRLGVTLTDGYGNLLGMHELLLRTADGFRNMTNATEKAGLATLLFGARNSKVLVSLDDGRRAIEGNIASFLRLGYINDRQATQLKALAQEFANFFNRVRSAIFGAIGEHAPVFEKLLQNIGSLVQRVGPKFVELLSTIADKWETIAEWIEKAIDAADRFFKAEHGAHLKRMAIPTDIWGGGVEGPEQGAAPAAGRAPRPVRITVGGGRTTEDTPRGSDFGVPETKKVTAQLERMKSTLDRFRDAARDAFNTFAESMREAYSRATDYGQQFSRVALSAVDSIVDGLASGTFDAKTFLKQLLADIVKVILKALIMQRIMAAIEGAQTGGGPLAQALRFLFGQGDQIGGSTDSSGVFLGDDTGVGFRQHGGPVHRGSPYIVGERGPELFTPGQSGMVHPHGALAGMGGVTVNFAPVINRGDPTQIRAEIRDAIPTLSDLIESTILQKQARPSAHRQAIRNV